MRSERSSARGRERLRLAQVFRGPALLAIVGPVSQRAAVGDGPRGLQPLRQRVGLLSARACPEQSLPVGRRRPGGVLGPPAAALPVARLVEPTRCHPKGTSVRTDQQRRQSRRGREGAVLLPGRDPVALLSENALQVSADGISVYPSRRGKPRPRNGCPRIRVDRYRCVPGRALFRRVR